MRKSNILVTGATGFTGSHLAQRLACDGHRVRALVRDPEQATFLQQQGIELVAGDLREPASLANAMHGIDTVYHIAATFRRARLSDETMWAINAGGVQNMLEAAVQARVRRFVHCSTVGVHGDIDNPPADEQTPYQPGDIYQVTKMAGEQIARSYMARGDLAITIFRPGGIYGPGDMRFLKLFRAIKRRHFVMLGSGNVLYQLVYVDDLVDGIIRCGTLEAAVGQIYILTGQSILTLNELAVTIADTLGAPKFYPHLPVMPVYWAGYLCELLCKPLGLEPPLYRRRVDFFRKDRAFSIDKARRELGYTPRVGLRTGLRRTAAWYAAQGLL